MRVFFSKFFLILAVPFLKLSNYFSPHRKKKNSIQAQRSASWFKADGDKTLRLDYKNLDKESVVFDVGGYEGNWAAEIFCKYNCSLYIFEPVPHYYSNIEKRFNHNERIKIFPFGLGGQDQKLNIGLLDDASSTYKSESDNKVEIIIKDISGFINANNIKKIHLMKINIEGGEYELLDSLLKNNLIKNIENLQIQFHDFVPDAKTKMASLQKSLSHTHQPTYQFEFVWENWQLIK